MISSAQIQSLVLVIWTHAPEREAPCAFSGAATLERPVANQAVGEIPCALSGAAAPVASRASAASGRPIDGAKLATIPASLVSRPPRSRRPLIAPTVPPVGEARLPLDGLREFLCMIPGMAQRYCTRSKVGLWNVLGWDMGQK